MDLVIDNWMPCFNQQKIKSIAFPSFFIVYYTRENISPIYFANRLFCELNNQFISPLYLKFVNFRESFVQEIVQYASNEIINLIFDETNEIRIGFSVLFIFTQRVDMKIEDSAEGGLTQFWELFTMNHFGHICLFLDFPWQNISDTT